MKCNPDKEMNEIYGAEHLLRLFVKLPDLINVSEMGEQTLKILAQVFTELLKYLEKHKVDLFLSEYVPVSSYYMRLTST
eukprot:gene12903-15157_t